MNEDQRDEIEVLQSIYEDDSNFKQVSETVYCYKFVCDDNELKSFMVQITWPKEYPESADALLDLDSFFNSHIKKKEKAQMLKRIQSQYGDWSGMAMTFNIINYVLDNVDFFKGVIRNEAVVEREERDKDQDKDQEKKPKAEMRPSTKGMTKGQKRRFYDKFGNIDVDEKPRGWNWVDVIKHLSKTGTS